MWRSRRAASEAPPPPSTSTDLAANARAVRQSHSTPDDSATTTQPDRFEVHRIGGTTAPPMNSSRQRLHTGLLASSPSSTASNVSVPIQDSPTRKRKQLAISNAFFGPSSQATDIYFDADQDDLDASLHEYYYHSNDNERKDSKATSGSTQVQTQQSGRSSHDSRHYETAAADAASRRRRRKENEEKFKQIARLTDAARPVRLSEFTRKSSRRLRRDTTSHDDSVYSAGPDRTLNTELLEAYVAYARSIGREPQLDIVVDAAAKPRATKDSDDDDPDHDFVTGRSPITRPRRPVVKEETHVWTEYIGTRHSKRRGCVQFWAWFTIGVVVSVIMAFFLAHLSLNEVLHLDAFVEQNVVVTDDFAYLHLRDEVSFRLKYDIVTAPSRTGASNASAFQVLLLYEDEFERYVEGKPFAYIPTGSTLRTTYASLPLTEIENDEDDEVYFVIQPCVLARNPTADYCQSQQLPTPLKSGRKVFKLKDRTSSSSTAAAAPAGLAIERLYVNPMPNTCSASGWKGGSYFLIFLPFVVLSLFGLRVFQMLWRCESFRANLERKYRSEFAVPENEVDYWQPMPWDRKVPKTRLLGPCCWKKMRKPFEPFYTWWRHENYFTWIFCPYRNERLSRGERAIIVFCSLYLTFYVLFVLVMLRDSLGANLTLFASVMIYYVLIMVLPSLGKAIFKEIFKLIFRQRRKYFRVQAANAERHGDPSARASGFSFRLAFLLQVLVTLCIATTQLPMFYIWRYRSCTFLKHFMYFGVLAAITRLSLLGLMQDYVWYVVIKTWGWRDLCPYCTERLVHCDCFNDELLVLSVERVGPKWELILLLDQVLAKQPETDYTAQFEQYSAEQLRERWDILVARARVHMDKVEKLKAYKVKKEQDRLRRERRRESFVHAASFLGLRETAAATKRDGGAGESTTDDDELRPSSNNIDALCDVGCCLREQKVLALHSQIELDAFEKHYDSTIVDVFHSIQDSLARRRRHAKRAWRKRRRDVAPDPMDATAHRHAADGDDASDHDDGHDDDLDRLSSATMLASGESSDSSSSGETMWVFDSPQQRLERREQEKLRRDRAFRVLDNYFIESVEPERDAQGHVHYVTVEPRSSAGVDASGAASPAAAAAPRAKSLVRKDSTYVKLLLRRQQSIPRDEDVVVVVSDNVNSATSPIHITVVEEEGASECESERASSSAAALRRESVESEASLLSALSVADHARDAAPVPPPPQSRTYAVMEKKPSLLRKVSTSATTFASWVFKTDPPANV